MFSLLSFNTMAVDNEKIKAKIATLIDDLFTRGTKENHDEVMSTVRILSLLQEQLPGDYDVFEVFEVLEELHFEKIRIGNSVEWFMKNK